MDLKGEFTERTLKATKTALQKAKDFEDLNNEIVGRDVGRHARFLPGENSKRSDDKEKKAERRFRTMLDLLLADPNYAAAYESADQAVRNAAKDADSEVRYAETALSEATGAFQTLKDRAALLPDGTRVYFDPASGMIMTEYGRALSDEEAGQIELRGDEPTYTDYLAARDKVKVAQDHLNVWYEYQLLLGGFRNELEDRDTPPSQKRLEQIEREVEERRPEALVSKQAFDNTANIDAQDQSVSVGQPKI